MSLLDLEHSGKLCEDLIIHRPERSAGIQRREGQMCDDGKLAHFPPSTRRTVQHQCEEAGNRTPQPEDSPRSRVGRGR